MNMQKILGAGAAVCGTVLLVLALIQAPRPSSASAGGRMGTTTVSLSYVVQEWNGQLAVFIKGQTHPDMIYEDVAVSALPPEEQERLRQGITVPDRAALNRLLEDYTS